MQEKNFILGAPITRYFHSGRSLENVRKLNQNQRQSERFKTIQSVIWHHLQYENQAGKIRDISSSGIFLKPEGAMLNEILYDDSVTIVLSVNEKDYVFSTRVRWVGFSKIHQALGMGLEFEKSSQDILYG